MAFCQMQTSSIEDITSSDPNAPCIHTVHKVRERCDMIDQRAKTGRKKPCCCLNLSGSTDRTRNVAPVRTQPVPTSHSPSSPRFRRFPWFCLCCGIRPCLCSFPFQPLQLENLHPIIRRPKTKIVFTTKSLLPRDNPVRTLDFVGVSAFRRGHSLGHKRSKLVQSSVSPPSTLMSRSEAR